MAMWWRVRSPTSTAGGAMTHEGSKALPLCVSITLVYLWVGPRFISPDSRELVEGVPGAASIHPTGSTTLRIRKYRRISGTLGSATSWCRQYTPNRFHDVADPQIPPDFRNPRQISGMR